MQYYYQCKESADRVGDEDSNNEPDDEPEDELDLREYINGIELKDAVLSRAKQKELEHAEKAAKIGIELVTTSTSTTGDPNHVAGWTQALREAAVQRLRSSDAIPEANVDSGDIEVITDNHEDSPNGIPSITYEGNTVPEQDVDISMLSAEQLRAFEIVRNHYLETHSGNKPDQLLMQIQGEGGTGKSLVISKITEFFRKLGKDAELRRSAYTGIAASLIEGSTLHQLAALHLCNSISKKTTKRLQDTWAPVNYLVIDEVSMVSKKILADVSQMISIGKQKEGEHNTTLAFGGINVIIAGDFHQFPPVIGGGGNGALYSPVGPKATSKMIIGRSIYEQFRTVVILKKQFRVDRDSNEWRGVLTRARHGKCTPKDLGIIRGLILDPTRDKNLLSQSGWDDAVLVTPRHSVRQRWNELASYNHCRSTGEPLFLSHAYDTHKDRPLDTKMKALLQAQ
ncbi:ATP-dependent helicase RRM3, partial [Rhizoctonia solani AG-3 Rhs1AP]